MSSFRNILTLVSAALVAFAGCGNHKSADPAADITQPQYLEIIPRAESGWTLVSISPFDGSRDTLVVTEPLRNLIVMSTSHVGFLDAIGRTDVISGVSGLDYLYLQSDEGVGGSDASLRSAPPLASLRSAPVPPLNVPRVAVSSPAGAASASLVLASDAFFPFDDCVTLAAQYGVKAIVQPGGSIRDEDSIKKCNELGIAMLFTGERHFKH